MPSLEASTLTGKSSKCWSRGSEGRTRKGRAILALRVPRFSGYCFGDSRVADFELGSFIIPLFALSVETSRGCAESDIASEAPESKRLGRGHGRENSQGCSRVEEATHAESILCDARTGDRTAVYRRVRGFRDPRYI